MRVILVVGGVVLVVGVGVVAVVFFSSTWCGRGPDGNLKRGRSRSSNKNTTTAFSYNAKASSECLRHRMNILESNVLEGHFIIIISILQTTPREEVMVVVLEQNAGAEEKQVGRDNEEKPEHLIHAPISK